MNKPFRRKLEVGGQGGLKKFAICDLRFTVGQEVEFLEMNSILCFRQQTGYPFQRKWSYRGRSIKINRARTVTRGARIARFGVLLVTLHALHAVGFLVETNKASCFADLRQQ